MSRRSRKREAVKGHYRIVIRDSSGRFITSRKWTSKSSR